MKLVEIPAYYYQQFDADYNLDVPAEGFGGWKEANLEMDLDRTAIAVMHAWDYGTKERYPGWYRTVEYFPRANEICRNVLPGLLKAARNSGIMVFHIAIPGKYLAKYPGYHASLESTAPATAVMEMAEADPVTLKLWKFKYDNAVPGIHNKADVEKGFEDLDFPKEVKPEGNEEIAVNADQLFKLCKKYGINHLIYTGFAINGCLLVSPGGIVDMLRRGILCSAIRQAVTAIENKETARYETGKEMGLWFLSIISGFVYDINDFLKGICKY